MLREDAIAPTFRLGIASSADVPEIVRLITEVLVEFDLQFGNETDLELLRLPHSYTSQSGVFWIARDCTDALLGTCGVVPLKADTYEVRKMYLGAKARGRGFGRAILGEAVRWVKERGGKHLVLDTTEQMTAAIHFYEANGFVRDDAQIRGKRCSRGYRRDL